MRLPSNQYGVHSNHGLISLKMATEAKYGPRYTNMPVLTPNSLIIHELVNMTISRHWWLTLVAHFEPPLIKISKLSHHSISRYQAMCVHTCTPKWRDWRDWRDWRAKWRANTSLRYHMHTYVLNTNMILYN